MNDEARERMWHEIEAMLTPSVVEVRRIAHDAVELAHEWLSNGVRLDLDDHGNVVVSVGEPTDRIVILAPLHEVVESWMAWGPSDPDSLRLKETLVRALAMMEQGEE